MFHPRNLIFAIFLVVCATGASDFGHLDHLGAIEKFDKFFANWDPKQTIVRDDLLISLAKNDSTHHRNKRASPNRLYPVNLASGTTFCSIPGYTGSHCEFPICDQYNRHDHGPPQPTPVGIAYDYHTNSTTPTWFNVDTTIIVLIIKLDSDTTNNPLAQLFYQDGTEVGNSGSYNISNGRETIYYYDVLGKPGVYWTMPFSASDNSSALRTAVSGISDIGMDIELGFVVNYGNNQPERSDFPSNYTYQGNLNVVVADVKFLEFPGSLVTVTIYSTNSELTLPSPLRVRYGCSYKYYFDAFYCRNIGIYYARFEGYDYFGYSFSRWAEFTCLPALETTPGTTGPTTPPPTSPTSCQNDGALITRDNGSYCYCQGLWAGVSCEIPLCANDGTIMPDNTCLCSGAWLGVHCEFLWCNDDAGIGFLNVDPMLVFVIRLRATVAPVIAQIRDQILQLRNEYSFAPEYFDRFGVAFFNNDQLISVNQYTSVDDFVAVLNTTSGNTDTNGGCRDSVYGALWQAVNTFVISKKSPIYVITDALPDDHLANQDNIYYKNSFWNAPINFIYLDSHPVTCPFDRYDPAYVAMWRMAERSAGTVHYISQDNFNNTGQLFYYLVFNTFYKGHLIYIDDERTCSNQPLYQTFSVDSTDRFWKLTFVVVGANITISLIDPDQNIVQPPRIVLDYQLDNSYVYRINGLQIGTWTFAVVSGTANTGCAFRIWALEVPFNTEQDLDYNLIWGATPAIVFDAPWREPIFQQPLHIVAHISNYPNATRPIVLYPEYVNAELTIHGQTDNGRQLVLASNGIWRSGCSMQIFFPIANTFTCQTQDQLLYLTIYVRDLLGYMIQRSGVFYCNYVQTTIVPPSPGQCLNSGVFYNNTCICPPDWTGDVCQTPVCFNGGTLFGNVYCQCPPGIGGPNCQFIQCLQQNPNPGFNIHRRSLAFLLDITRYNAATLSLLARGIQQTIADIRSQHLEWIENYYVYAFNSTGVFLLASAQPYDEALIVNAFGTAASWAAGGDAACGVQTYQAIIEASAFMTRNSFIYVYQTALPSLANFDAVLNASYTVDQTRHMLMVYASQDDPTYFGPPECNGTIFDYELLEEIAYLSQGRFFNIRSSSTPDSLKLLPTMYSSGVVYHRYFNDCSQAQTVFAPLDTYAQSMQVIIHGLGANGGQLQYQIFRPNGSAYDPNLIGTYINDQLNGWQVLDLRAICDDGWESNGNPSLPYCYTIANLAQYNWTIARDYCYVAGAYLADASTADADGMLATIGGNNVAFWIGLNDINQTGAYFWDRGPYLPPATFNGSVFSNWAPGQPVNNSATQCVYRLGQWIVDDCNTSRYFICQKYKYSASFNPNNLDDYDLPAGRWAVTVNGGNGSCSVEVRVQSTMQLFTGYVRDIHSDLPTAMPTWDSTDNRIVAYVPGFDPQATSNVAFLTGAFIQYESRNTTIYEAATYEYRTSCQYQFLSQNFTCPVNGDPRNRFRVLHTGKDSRGLPFQRMNFGRCSAQRICLNGGVPYNGACVCNEYFTGENCTQPVCVNGGYLDPTNQNLCVCPSGFTGRACQYITCPVKSTNNFLYTNKTFLLVVEKTVQNQAAITSLQTNLPVILGGLGSTWFTSFVLVLFDSTGVVNITTTTYLLDFENAFNAATASVTDPGACNLGVFDALTQAATVTGISVAQGSIQYLVTAAAPSDADMTNNVDRYFAALSGLQLKLYYILGKSTCSQDPNEPHVNALVDFSYGSDGDVVIINQADVGAHAATYITTVVNASLIGTPTFAFSRNSTCNNLTYYFEVDRHSSLIFLSTYTPILAPKPTVIDAAGNPLSVDEMYSDASNHYLYKIANTGQGIYAVSYNSANANDTCLLQVRIQGALRYTTGYIASPTFTSNSSWSLDNATSVPTGPINVLVVHVENDEVALTYAEIYNPWIGVRTLVSFYGRDPQNCSYQFVSDTFDCPSRGLLIHLYGFDVHGQPFRRSSYTYCAAFVPQSSTTPGSPPTTVTTTIGTATTETTTTGTTQSGATTQSTAAPPTSVTGTVPTQPTTTTSRYFTLNVDIVFLFDISSAVDNASYVDVTTFFLNSLGTFNIATGPNNPNGTRFAIIQVPGDTGWGVPLISSGFSTITSYQQLQKGFSDAFPDPQYDPVQSAGQTLLANATALVNDPNLLATGYRTSINNHLVIYVTTTSSPDANAIAAAAAVIASNAYSFMALAYRPGTNVASLTSYIGGSANCVMQAPDATTLNTRYGAWLAEVIFNASNANGVYSCPTPTFV